MHRRSALLVAVTSALGQALYLFAYEPLRPLVTGTGTVPLQRDVRFHGLDLDGFVVRDTAHVGGWLPQVVFVILAAVLTYGVLRVAAPGSGPRWGTVWSLLGVLLLTAGVVDVLDLLTGMRPREVAVGYDEWVGDARVDDATGLPAQFALLMAWLPLLVVAEVWLLQRWPVFRPLLGTPEDDGPGAAPGGVTAPTAAGRRWDVVAAGLTPAVLLALAGGPVLRHTHVRHMEQTSSVTFDPDLWLPYRPPGLIREWSGLLYPALRLRPLPTEDPAGWRATCAVCLVFLVVLAVALYVLAVRAGGKRPVRVVVECWCATLLAAVAAAVVESGVLQNDRLAPRPDPLEAGTGLTLTVGDAVRFGTCWGWAVGASFLLGLWAVSRRRHAAPAGAATEKEGRLSHAE